MDKIKNMNKKIENVTPLGLNIIIKQVDKEVETSSGMIMSGADKENLRYKQGLVIKPGVEVDEKLVKAGDSITYDKRAGYTMFIGGESFTIIKFGDISTVGL